MTSARDPFQPISLILLTWLGVAFDDMEGIRICFIGGGGNMAGMSLDVMAGALLDALVTN